MGRQCGSHEMVKVDKTSHINTSIQHHEGCSAPAILREPSIYWIKVFASRMFSSNYPEGTFNILEKSVHDRGCSAAAILRELSIYDIKVFTIEDVQLQLSWGTFNIIFNAGESMTSIVMTNESGPRVPGYKPPPPGEVWAIPACVLETCWSQDVLVPMATSAKVAIPWNFKCSSEVHQVATWSYLLII